MLFFILRYICLSRFLLLVQERKDSRNFNRGWWASGIGGDNAWKERSTSFAHDPSADESVQRRGPFPREAVFDGKKAGPAASQWK